MASPRSPGLIARLLGQTWLCWLGVIIWFAVLFTLSSRSTLPPGPQIPYQDKVMHFLYFSGGAFCFALARLNTRSPAAPAWVWWLHGTAFGGLIGILDEYHQTFTPGRSGNDPWDWLADVTGAGFGAFLAYVLLRFVTRRGTAKPAAR